MSTIEDLNETQLEFDYVIVGGGTAGCVIASRLAEALPEKKILMIEGGPSDYKQDHILDLKRALEMWGGDYDYNYTSTEQPHGNSHIQHSRAKVLGGCSSHNGSIAFRPMEYDARKWQEMGAHGWTFETFVRLVDKLRTTRHPVTEKYQNAVDKAFVESCSRAFNIPKTTSWNEDIKLARNLEKGSTGFLELNYNPENGYRSSASTAYIHPILDGKEKRPNLTMLLNAWVYHINIINDRATSLDIKLKSGRKLTVAGKEEIVLCAGAFDTPRLMLLSGIGPRQHLASVGIPVIKDVPGVGENLMDHPESLIMWELKEPYVPQTANFSDVSMFLRREAPNARGDDNQIVDTLFHMFALGFDANTLRLGYETPANAYCLIPNVPRPRSRGRIYLHSANPEDKPAIDPRYFSDPEGYDKATILWELKKGRELASVAPFSDLIKREVFPGPEVKTDDELSEYGRKAHNTVYHPCGTAKMGDLAKDPLAVVGPDLKVRGIAGLRIADASVFPIITSVNPMLTVLAVGERAAEFIIDEAKISARKQSSRL